MNRKDDSGARQAPTQTPEEPWISFTSTHLQLEQLQELCHSEEQLIQAGYVTQELSSDQLRAKQRCIRCTARTTYRPGRHNKAKSLVADKSLIASGLLPDGSTELGSRATAQQKPPKPVCQYHSGPVIKQICQSCTKRSTQTGCMSHDAHQFLDIEDPAYQRFWKFHHTPEMSSTKQQRLAVVIDCEMGMAATGDSELIRLSVIDLFTKETLIDKIVKPQVYMQHLNTKYSGVTWKDIRQAEAQRNCFTSKQAVRKALFTFIGPNTIVVAHSGNNDFSALRWIHPRIIDTFLLYQDRHRNLQEAEQLVSDMIEANEMDITVEEVRQRRKAEAKADGLQKSKVTTAAEQVTEPLKPKKNEREKRGPGTLSLKALVKQYADIDIQTGSKGHCSLEDAFGCRELVIRFLMTEPDVSQYLAELTQSTDSDQAHENENPDIGIPQSFMGVSKLCKADEEDGIESDFEDSD